MDDRIRGYTRACVISARSRAVMELLDREKRGEVLSDHSVGKVTRNPLNGEAFAFDAANRLVSLPPDQDHLNILPIALP